ncbi:hypothetical protein HPP92_002250 [Vanilla planifolia]|uniref:Uncharacterized protein n=1 Tax=Vanilla planifolia TaxID=51239 RepID=A0A835RW11_VANPL|nr:hypothetical protein HPP92_002509 [Vanilla planifolia]KAG0502178.1 hypothetical protein HPP92_002250 [Vanilla planifolia]
MAGIFPEAADGDLRRKKEELPRRTADVAGQRGPRFLLTRLCTWGWCPPPRAPVPGCGFPGRRMSVVLENGQRVRAGEGLMEGEAGEGMKRVVDISASPTALGVNYDDGSRWLTASRVHKLLNTVKRS